jgi:amino acid transporter
MKIHIIFIAMFIVLMLIMHVWFAYRDHGKWPWRSKRFWIGEARVTIVFVVLVTAILIFGGRYKTNSWFWENRAFSTCDWGMSPKDVLRVEILTGRPSGTVAPPQLKPFGELFHAMHAEKRHLYPPTQHMGRSPRSYFFYDNRLISGCTYTFYPGQTDRVRDQIARERRKNTIAYGDPVYKKSDDMKVMIWDFDARSYLGIIITVDEQNGQVVKRRIYMDKYLDMETVKIFTDHFLTSPDPINIF